MSCRAAMERYRTEYSVKNLGASCKDDEKESFFEGSCIKNRLAFFIYRLIVFGYAVGMTIWAQVYIKNDLPQVYAISYLYFTNWGDILSTSYFFLAALLALIGGLLNYDNKFLKILRSATWIFFTLDSTAQLLLTPIYWAFPPCVARVDCLDIYLNFHRHGMSLILIFIDMWISAFPIRLLHFLYPAAGATVYIIISAIGHLAGRIPAVYELLDWHESPGRTAAMMLAVGWIGPFLAQHIWFLLYLVRQRFSNCCHRGIARPDIGLGGLA